MLYILSATLPDFNGCYTSSKDAKWRLGEIPFHYNT